MKQKFILLFSLCCVLFAHKAIAQDNSQDLVQFSGMVLDGSTEELIPLPFVNILVKEKGRGTYTDYSGFFSIVVEKEDVIVFSAIGYETVEYAIPDTLTDNRYSLVQLMTKDINNLPAAVVFPWPNRDHFKLEFLAMDITGDLQSKANTNLANETLERMRSTVASDGVENASYYLRKQSREYYHIGQNPPMNIFSPVAWKQFFDAWQRGDYKRKRKE